MLLKIEVLYFGRFILTVSLQTMPIELLFEAHIEIKNQHMILNTGDNQQHIQINRYLIITKQAAIKSQQK